MPSLASDVQSVAVVHLTDNAPCVSPPLTCPHLKSNIPRQSVPRVDCHNLRNRTGPDLLNHCHQKQPHRTYPLKISAPATMEDILSLMNDLKETYATS